MRIYPLQSIGLLIITVVAAFSWQGKILSQGTAEAKKTHEVFGHAANGYTTWWTLQHNAKPYTPPKRTLKRPTQKYVRTQTVKQALPMKQVTSVHKAQQKQPSYQVRKARIIATASVLPSPRIEPLLPVVDQDDIKDNHKKIADEVLRVLPAKCRHMLKNFYVRYDNPESRGLGGKDTIILSGNVPDDEFRALFIHELGHVFDLNQNTGCLGGSPSTGSSEFRDGKDIVYNDDPSLEFYRISWIAPKIQKTGVKAEDFVSGYASWDVFEDFAESFAYFTLHNESFRQRAQTNAALAAKYQWFQRHLYPETPTLAQSGFVWRNDVPWDITKLPYTWNGKSLVANNR